MAGKPFAKKGAAPAPSTKEDFLPKKKQAPSLLNVLLLYSTLIGLGAIGGYFLFYTLFHARCADILDENELRHNVTRQELNGKYLAAVEEHYKCLEQETTQLEISELRNRLDAQASLTGKQNTMLEQNQDSAERLANLHAMHEETLLKFHNLQSEVSQKESELAALKQDIAVYTREQDMLEKQLINQDEHDDNILSKKVQEARQFRNEKDACQAARKIMEMEAKEIKDHIQHRHGALCRETHGQGPYYLEFHLQFPDGAGTDSFVVEFPSRKELPHSVFTFIDLVESKLYDDTSILSKGDGAMRIGASPQHMSRLSQRYKALGYGKSALSFIESSQSFPCRRHSVGFVGRGPGLEIHTSDHNVHDQDRTCLGRVVHGMNVLARVEALIEHGEVVDIAQVRHAQIPDATSRREL